MFIGTVKVSFSQEMSGSEMCSIRKRSNPNPILNNGDSPNTPRHKYDVLNYRLNLDIRNCFLSPYPHNFTGSEIITFRIDTALNSITLNAVNTSLAIDSVGLSAVSFTHTNNILTLNLNRTYNPAETTQVRIYYRHLNVSDGAFYTGNGGVFTDAEPEGARKWFPSWDRPYDKATLDLTAKVPANAKLGSNGRLNDSTLIGDTLYYHWISRDPISTYLIVMTAKVNYNLNIVYWHRISNPADSVPIRFYYNSGENPVPMQNIIVDMTNYYSGKFGEMAFEKNGFTTAPAPGFTWGGMENQTLTTFCAGCWSSGLMSHEYAHQWYGDLVTCGTWADIWLNEGFATYTEALWAEHTGGYSSYKSTILNRASSYLSGNPGWPMYNPAWADSTPNVNVLFNYAITYCKGAGVLHMLRYVLQDTAIFFNCMRGYAMDTVNFKYKNAVTDDFTAKISAISGQNLSWFIDEWVKLPNHPVYQNIYQFTTNGGSNWTVGFQATQIQSNSPFHMMPIVLRISFASGPDTTIRTLNKINNQIYYWNFNRQPTAFAFDPDNDIVLKQGSTGPGIINGIVSNETPLKFELKQNYPNPFNAKSIIKYQIAKNSFVKLIVYNVSGQEVTTLVNEQLKPGTYEAEFDGTNYASGVYIVKMTAGSFTDMKKIVLVK